MKLKSRYVTKTDFEPNWVKIEDEIVSVKTKKSNPKYEEIGIAVLKGDFNGKQTTIVVQLFGRLENKLVVKETEENKEQKPENIEQVIKKTEEEQIELDIKTGIAGLRKEVLGETYIEQSINRKEKDSKFKFFEFMALNYDNLVQRITFYSLLFILLCSLINIFVKFNIQRKDLLFKIIIFVCVLILFIFLNKSFIIQLIPHNLGIY